MRFDPTTSILAGVAVDVLQKWLSDAQNARAALASGQQVVSVTVTGGGQHREVQYRRDPNSLAMLDDWIRQLQAQLGVIPSPRRRARITFN